MGNSGREHETKGNAMLGGIVPELIETEPYSGVANYSRTICWGSLSSPQANKTRMPQTMPVRCPFRELDLRSSVSNGLMEKSVQLQL